MGYSKAKLVERGRRHDDVEGFLGQLGLLESAGQDLQVASAGMQQ